MMLNFVLDGLQPYRWARKSETLATFEEYYFSSLPGVTLEQASELLCGRGAKGKGLLETVRARTPALHRSAERSIARGPPVLTARGAGAQVSTATWPQGHLKGSAGAAVRLILRLLDPTQHGGWRRPSALPRASHWPCLSLTHVRSCAPSPARSREDVCRGAAAS